MARDEEEEAACPVCGKSVGLDVSSCPYCGAEFEEEADVIEEEAAVQVAEVSHEEEEVGCPVCGALVGLDVSSCPKCGAEFEEEEIEEVIEVEEKEVFEVEKPKPVPAKARPAPSKAKPPARAKPAREKPAPARARPRTRPSPAAAAMDLPSGLTNLKVIGLSLAILGIIGLQVALMIDWYWEWVPPIEDNLGLFVAVPLVVLIVGLLAFMLVKKAVSGGKKMPSMMPTTTLALFMFGIFALIVIVFWNPINSALQDSQGAVAGGFALALVVGIVLLFMGMRAPQKAAY